MSSPKYILYTLVVQTTYYIQHVLSPQWHNLNQYTRIQSHQQLNQPMHDHKHYSINPNSQHHPIRLSNHSIPVPITLTLPIHKNQLHTIKTIQSNPVQSIRSSQSDAIYRRHPSIQTHQPMTDHCNQRPANSHSSHTHTLTQLSVLICSLMNELLLINILIQ